MLKLLTGIALLIFWVAFFIAGIAQVDYSSNDGDGGTAATKNYATTVQMVLDVTYDSVKADEALLKSLVEDIEKVFTDSTTVNKRRVGILADGDDGGAHAGADGADGAADGGAHNADGDDGGDGGHASPTTVAEVKQLCRSGSVPLVCTERDEILKITGQTATHAGGDGDAADGDNHAADGDATADGDGRAASTLAAGDLVVRVEVVSTSADASRTGAERAAAVIDGQWATITFSGRHIIATGRPRVVAAPADGAPTSTVFLEVTTPVEYSQYTSSADFLTFMTAIEAEILSKSGAATTHRGVAVAADGDDADAGADGDAQHDTYTEAADQITETSTHTTRICNVQADNTLTECMLKSELDVKRGIQPAQTAHHGDGDGDAGDAGHAGADGDADADGGRAAVLATGTMRVEVTFTSLTNTMVNAAATQAVSQWTATTVGGLTVSKNPLVLTVNTNKRDVKVLADGDDAGGAADGGAADGGAADGGADGAADGADGAYGDAAPTGSNPRNRWEPKRGVIDGQGCVEDGCLSHKQPYFVWTRLIQGDKHNRGGMIYFEWRGDNGDVIAYLILGWVILFLIMALVGFLMKNKYQKALNGPISPTAEMIEQFLPFQIRFYWGQFIVNLWIVGWCLLCFFYVWNHATINNLVGKTSRGIGGVVAGLLVLQLFPVSRHSVLLWSFGIPFERALAFHRRIGGWIWVLTLCHFIGMFADHMRYYRQGVPVYATQTYRDPASANRAARLAFERMFRWEIGYPHGPPAAGFIAWVAMTIVAVGALSYIRRNYWKVFVISHLMYIVVYVMAWIHYPSLMIYCGIPVLLYVADLLSRNIQASCLGDARIHEHDARKGGITKLTIEMKSFSFEPTQYVLVKIPSISSLDWHPFSISSRGVQKNGKTRFSIHVKANGPDSWTAAVANKDLTGEKIAVQGPFGNTSLPGVSKLTGYNRVIMCTGGVGITPALSLLEQAVKRKTTPDDSMHVQFVWAGRGADAFQCFGPELAACHSTADSDGVTFSLYNTADDAAKFVDVDLNDNENPTYSLPVSSGRPNYSEIFDECDSKTAVFACGPEPMVRAVEEAAYEKGLDFHKEVFEF
eukprot:TRINITY_DN387_c0_g1_i6.p1 TRINITY_DN387_c0_g1~~TRINITY_DN387_c0_g1_i6.p1  ORF type:complete len:1088 (+),score=264.66 TRINITY_DN387_c0_g1_i6:90-3353(+)